MRRFATFLVALTACTERATTHDVLLEMLAAQCERSRRCNCSLDGAASFDCETHAAEQAAELREEARMRGATILDEECAELARDSAEHACQDAGVPPEREAYALSARVRACRPTLMHGTQAEGAPCEHPSDQWWVLPSDCDRGLFCIEGHDGPVCSAIDPRREGFVCRDIDMRLECPVDLACVTVERDIGRCLPFTTIGAPCIGLDRDVCVHPEGQWCDVESGTCRASPSMGEPCVEANGDACSSDAYCDDSICRARGGPRDACVEDSHCVLGLECEDGVCVGAAACGF